MVKLYILLFLLISTSFVNSQENPIIKSLRDKMLENITRIDSYKIKMLDLSSDISAELKSLTENGLERLYYYNEKKVMFNESKITQTEIPISVIHENYINLIVINQIKIYISEIYNIKGGIYYFIGCRNDKISLLFLFSLKNTSDYNNNFALFNSKGIIFFSRNVVFDKLKPYLTQINNPKTDTAYYFKNNIIKFKFLPIHDVYYFIDFF